MDEFQPSAAVWLLLSAGKARVKAGGILLQTRGYAKPVLDAAGWLQAGGILKTRYPVFQPEIRGLLAFVNWAIVWLGLFAIIFGCSYYEKALRTIAISKICQLIHPTGVLLPIISGVYF
jgi:hypothetical protein